MMNVHFMLDSEIEKLTQYLTESTGESELRLWIDPTDINNLGQQVSSFVQYYKVIFKQQREE